MASAQGRACSANGEPSRGTNSVRYMAESSTAAKAMVRARRHPPTVPRPAANRAERVDSAWPPGVFGSRLTAPLIWESNDAQLGSPGDPDRGGVAGRGVGRRDHEDGETDLGQGRDRRVPGGAGG